MTYTWWLPTDQPTDERRVLFKEMRGRSFCELALRFFSEKCILWPIFLSFLASFFAKGFYLPYKAKAPMKDPLSRAICSFLRSHAV